MTTGCQHTLSWWWIRAETLWPWVDIHDWCLRDPVYLQGMSPSSETSIKLKVTFKAENTHKKILPVHDWVTADNVPLSPPPKDHTVWPSCATAMVWELPQATWPTPLMSFTSVGMFRLWLSLWPGAESTRVLLGTVFPLTNKPSENRSPSLSVFTKSTKVSFSPGVKLSVISHGSAVSIASRHTNYNLRET